MNKTISGILGTSLAGLFVLFALHGTAFLEAIAGVPMVIERWSAPSALGAWSVLAGLVIPIGVDLALDRWLCRFVNAHTRIVLIELITAIVAVLVVFLLLPTLPGMLLGLGCGMFAPLFARAVKALIEFVMRNIELDP